MADGKMQPNRRSVVISIGSFDGAHRGHAALIARARELAGPDGQVIAMSFYPHPMTVLRPESAPARLTSFRQRSERLRKLGADEVVPLEPGPDLLSMTAEQFIEWLVERYHPTSFVEGPDFRFGKGRAGDNVMLRSLGETHGFTVEVVESVDVGLSDQSVVRASSTIARWLLDQGRVGDAAAVLGRPYEICGTVRQGDQRGRLLGYPTANVETECMLPRDGVYAGEVTIPGDRVMPAAVHIGPRSTFERMNRTIEVYAIGWDGPLTEGGEEYGWPISVRLTRWLRDQAKYDSAADLCVQMARDVQRASDLFSVHAEGTVG